MFHPSSPNLTQPLWLQVRLGKGQTIGHLPEAAARLVEAPRPPGGAWGADERL